MRKTALVLLAALALTSCNANPPDSSTNENEVIGGQVTVNFLSSAEQWSTEDVVTANKDYYTQHEPDYIKADATQTPETYMASLYAKDDQGNTPLNFWKVGTINNGTYAGQTLVLATQTCDGPCQPDVFRYAVDESANHWTALLPYSNGDISAYVGGPANDQEASIDIPALDTPATLNVYQNDLVRLADPFSSQDPNYYNLDQNQKDNFNNTKKPTALSDLTGPNFNQYFSSETSSCVYGETPDGILVRYQVMPPSFGFIPAAKGATMAQPNESADFTLTLSDGTTEARGYTVTAGGCGFAASCVATTMPDDSDTANLVELGTITRQDNGMQIDGSGVNTVYTLKTVSENPDAGELAKIVAQAYDSYKMGAQYRDNPEAISIKEFVAKHDVLLIKLDSGAYALAFDAAHSPAVECGKPVIYLYPTAAEQVSVKVNNITFSKTVPAYGNGWTVWAEPSGVLKNLADGKTYPYLFWEGQSSAKLSTDLGWTLAKKDIASKLPVALMSMGLSSKESADFMEFWLPKLQAVTTPYVQFNFEGTAAMNQVAPLSITPAPDSLLRVFMVYQGVNHAGLSMPAYTAPARSGFSVVEWGGTLY